ncbi:MAG: CRISPR-associated helicase Cas3' [Balneolaceae bacterium]
MPVYSHSRIDEEGKRVGSKYLIDHLRGVRNKAIGNYSKSISFSHSEMYRSLLDCVCWLHDLGKYTSYFQTYLLEPEKADRHLKTHSSLGAHAAFSLLKDKPQNALFAYFLIKLHHSNLINFDQVLWPDHYNENKWEIRDTFEKQATKLNQATELSEHFPDFNANFVQFTEPKTLFNLYKKKLKKADSIEYYYILNYLFSLLIESDKLDASDTEPYGPVSLPENAVDKRPNFGKPLYPEGDLQTFSQNELRNFVRSEVVKNLGQKDILQKKIFTLAAPTGIGKTMTALDFSLKLRKKIETEEGYLPQIIYGLPFINIIEQALSEYEVTLGEGKILGHYQYADVFGADKADENSLKDEERSYSRKKMAWDTWQSDIVITSFVQLFQTLIGNRNKLLKKFHHFAESIIILDEVQTLSIEKLPVIGAALYYLCRYLNARVILMTATQPKLFELMERELEIKIEEEHLKPFNLLKRDWEVFSCFNRTRIVPLIEEKIDNEAFVEYFFSKWSSPQSCLIVLNKVSRSIELFGLLKVHLQDKDVELIYLSTNITPVERKQRIERIKNLLTTKTCILVSTQVVEAGVDLDFDMGFRDLGPIDSIVQVAGRINRENSGDRKGAPLYVVDFGDCQRIYGHATESNARSALTSDEIFEKDYKEVVEQYFAAVSNETQADFRKSKEIFDAMKNLKYGHPSSSKAKKFTTVSDFKIIENSQNGVSVFVELPEDMEGSEARRAFQLLLKNEMPRHEFERKFKRSFHQRILTVPDYLHNIRELKKEENLLTEEILWVKPDLSGFYYRADTTGFIRKDDTETSIMF